VNAFPQPQHSEDLPQLLLEVNLSPFIGEITLQEIEDLIQHQSIRFYYQDGQLVGFGAWVSITPDWVEIGPLYVAQNQQGHGTGRHITEDVIAWTQHLNQYAITRNPRMMKIFVQQGFEQVSFFRLPLAIQWFALRKLTPTKIMRFAAKFSPDPVMHLIKPAQASTKTD
jgi:GNAT superfamily N-acetyltransferase